MSNSQQNHLPGLSIIRTIAAFSVLFGHMYQFGSWGIEPAQRVWLPEIYLPVTTFFVISGFLITWGLLREWDKTGDVAISQAYRRRAIRILPLYYIGIVVGFLSLWLLGDPINGNPTLLLCLLPNISHVLGDTPFPMWHYWTLGTEVMFYLWFPWIIKYGRRHLLPIVGSICAGWLLLKLGSYAILGKGFVYRFVSATQFDTIMFGAIGAILFYEQRDWLRRICGQWWFAVLTWCLFLTTQLWVPLLPSVICAEAIGVLSLMLILSAFCGHPVLENGFTRYMGKLSYGIYIFHPIVIYVLSSLCIRSQIICECAWGGYLEVFAVMIVTIGLTAIADWGINRVTRLSRPSLHSNR